VSKWVRNMDRSSTEEITRLEGALVPPKQSSTLHMFNLVRACLGVVEGVLPNIRPPSINHSERTEGIGMRAVMEEQYQLSVSVLTLGASGGANE
jgi:hypothetical protein